MQTYDAWKKFCHASINMLRSQIEVLNKPTICSHLKCVWIHSFFNIQKAIIIMRVVSFSNIYPQNFVNEAVDYNQKMILVRC